MITALFILVAPFLIPLLVPSLDQATQDLTVGLSQLLFPILVMLGVSGVVVGVLNSYNRFAVFAIAPLFWNLAIIGVLVALAPMFSGDDGSTRTRSASSSDRSSSSRWSPRTSATRRSG